MFAHTLGKNASVNTGTPLTCTSIMVVGSPSSCRSHETDEPGDGSACMRGGWVRAHVCPVCFTERASGEEKSDRGCQDKIRQHHLGSIILFSPRMQQKTCHSFSVWCPALLCGFVETSSCPGWPRTCDPSAAASQVLQP